MTPDRWRQIEAYYQAACDGGSDALADAPEDVRGDVERMLAQRSSGAAGSNILDAGLGTDATQTTITPGAMLGPYRIDAPIGQGGMGQVYRATDTRLDRTVAIKTTLTPFDPRFQREARAIATLNHPNICTLHDIGPNYLVMELCEGETLEARIKRGKLSIEDTCRIGSQIAAALAAAHAKDIVHRDLKPANIMLTRTGVKVLDFGLAKSPTDDTVTHANMIVGTPAYMAPEQRSGGLTDSRTDIYALGLILSEMIFGRRLAPGETPPATNVPLALSAAIQRCLAANPNERWQSAEALESVVSWSRQEPPTASAERPVSRRRVAAIALAVVTGLGLTGWFGFHRRGLQPEAPSMHLDIAPPPGTTFRHMSGFAISPDGSKIAFVAQGEGAPRIWVRPLDSPVARPLDGTENAFSPFWSPDSRSIGFFVRGKLQRIDVDGGFPRLICSLTTGAFAGGAWNSGGVILFSGAHDGPLLKVSAEGGTPQAVTVLDPASGENSHRWPVFLPGGRRFLYYIRAGHTDEDPTNYAVSGVYTGSLDDPNEKHRVQRTPLSGEYSAARGRLLYVSPDGNLVSQLMDPATGRLSGEPLNVTSGMTSRQAWRRADVSISGNGSLVYGKTGATKWQLTWYERNGQPVGAVGEPENLDRFRIAPDGKRVAVHRGLGGIWDLEFSRGIWTKLSDGVFGPVWSPDSRAVVTTVGAPPNLFLNFVDSTRGEQRLTDSRDSQVPSDWSGNGRLLFQATPNDGSVSSRDGLWTLEMVGIHRAAPLASTQFGDYGGVFSPDRRAIAFVSTQSGASEIYVQSFPDAAHRRKISSHGGVQVRWRGDGKELFYLSTDFKLMAVPMRRVNGEPDPGSPVPLFVFPNHNLTPPETTYDAMPDGQRFLVSVPIGPDIPTLNVITNWRP